MGLLETFFGKDASLLYDRSFQVLLFASVSSPLGASVVSPLLDTLTGSFGVSEAEIGLLIAVFTAPAIVMIPLVGMLSDRYGRKPVLTTGLLVFGLAGLAIPFTTDFRVVLALRLLQGIGYTGIGPVLIASVGDLYRGDREATAQGLRFTTVGLSLAVFPLLAGLLVTLAWQYPFYLFGIAVPTALVVHVAFEEPASDGDADDENPPFRELLSLLRDGHVLATVLGRAVPSVLWFSFLTYNSIVVVQLLDGTPQQAGVLVALSSIASSAGSTQLGRLTAGVDSRRRLLAGAITVQGLGIAAIGVAPTFPVAAAGSLLAGGGFGVSLSLYRSVITGLSTTEHRGGLVSLGESVGRIGSTGTPVVMGASIALLSQTASFGDAVRTTIVGGAVVVTLAGWALLFVGGGESRRPVATES
ncbi:MAG: MFS transporter [Haloferacaceae archaeon]